MHATCNSSPSSSSFSYSLNVFLIFLLQFQHALLLLHIAANHPSIAIVLECGIYRWRMFCFVFFLSSESTFCTCKCYPVRNTKYTESMMRHVVRGSALPLRHSHSLKSPCEMMAFDDFQCSSHVCSVDCRTLSDRNAFLKNKFAKYHHFLSLSILFLSIEDETIPPPLVGYILSKYLRDSFKKFCNTHTHTQIRLI